MLRHILDIVSYVSCWEKRSEQYWRWWTIEGDVRLIFTLGAEEPCYTAESDDDYQTDEKGPSIEVCVSHWHLEA